MTGSRGQFAWYELMSTDPEAAKTFYAGVVGWGMRDASTPGMSYTLLTAGETPVAGLMSCEEAAKIGSVWTGYVGTDDVDGMVERIKQLGGSVLKPPADIPGVGRFAVVADPQSAVFALIKWTLPGQMQPAETGAVGTAGWHELMTTDLPKALEFYTTLFGWQKSDAMDMGEMGVYQIFSDGERQIGGMFTKPPNVPAPFWLYYFVVKGIDAAAGRVTAGGGKILHGPMEVPGGMWIVQCMDPQGAMFALVGSKAG